MRVKNRGCRISGLCLPWQPFVFNHRRTRFAETAFSPWLRTDDHCFLRLSVNHQRSMPLARLGFTSLRWTPEGLQLSARLDTASPTTRLTAMAIKHGWLRHLSATVAIHGRPIQLRDDIGKLDLITRAEIREVAVTHRPIVGGTSVGIIGHSAPAAQSLPEKPEDREALQAFLARIGIDATPPKPATHPKPEPTVLQIYNARLLAAFDASYENEPQQHREYRPAAIKPTTKVVSKTDNRPAHSVSGGFWV